jgi:hypothetical protein
MPAGEGVRIGSAIEWSPPTDTGMHPAARIAPISCSTISFVRSIETGEMSRSP